MIPYIDFHCDTLWLAHVRKAENLLHLPDAMVDVDRLVKGGCTAQFFAIFMWPQPMKDPAKDEQYIQTLLDIFHRSLDGRLAPARNLRDYQANRQAGKISGFLTLEDGRAVQGRMEHLERFYQIGIRLISLTWNHVNCFGSPNSPDPEVMARGLTDFGRDAVGRMNELGMLVDVSHLSDGGFWDVAQISQQPFVASHSNCRALNPHPRSLSDEMIRALADHGGVMGLNFCPEFLTPDLHSARSCTEDLVRQLRHMVNTGGVECAALGSDLDGIHGQLEIGSADRIPLLLAALDRAGFHESEIEHIAWKNAQRLLEVLK